MVRSSRTGVKGIVGAVYQRHDLLASYTFGLSESDAVYWGGDLNTAVSMPVGLIPEQARLPVAFPLICGFVLHLL